MQSLPMAMDRSPLRERLCYHAKTVWLFTRSDLKTIVLPCTLFAVVFALSGLEQNPKSTYLDVTRLALNRLPPTVFWIWINLLPFAIGNQRKQDSIEEDLENKPWRPLPAKRIAPNRAVLLMKCCYAVATLCSIRLGGLLQCATLILLGYWYNDAKGADCHFMVRNLINGAGYISFVSGSLEVILERPATTFQPKTLLWLLIIGAVVLTSIHAQDMPDQAGDRIRSRKTVPLVLGDVPARWAIAVGVTAWSYVCPSFWQVNAGGFALPVLIGGVVSSRFLLCRSVAADKMSFLIYNLWIVVLYCLPLTRRLQFSV